MNNLTIPQAKLLGCEAKYKSIIECVNELQTRASKNPLKICEVNIEFFEFFKVKIVYCKSVRQMHSG